MTTEAKIFLGPEINEDIENKDFPVSLTHIKNSNHQLPSKHYGQLKKLTGPGQVLQKDFTGKLHNKTLNSDEQFLIAADRLTKWPAVNVCRISKKIR